jgi:hypothetical protein
MIVVMARRLTGLGGFGFQVEWENLDGDAEVARRVVTFLEDRRLLYSYLDMEDAVHCIRSVLAIREFLTNELASRSVGRSLGTSLRAMRTGCRAFLEKAGPDGRVFREESRIGIHPFDVALGELRALFGMQLTLVVAAYDLDVEPDLRALMPPPLDDDGSLIDWLPGF